MSKQYPYSCMEVFKTTLGPHDDKVYDYYVLYGNNNNPIYVFPYYIKWSISGASVINGNNMFVIKPSIPQSLPINEIHFHAAHKFKNSVILSGRVVFSNPTYILKPLHNLIETMVSAIYHIFASYVICGYGKYLLACLIF